MICHEQLVGLGRRRRFSVDADLKLNSNMLLWSSLVWFNCTTQGRLPGSEQSLAILASLYVHIMIRRFVPSLATEMHLTIRLLHVHSEVTRSGGDRTLKFEQGRREDHSPIGSSAISSKEIRDGQHGTSDRPGMKIIFKTGLDCRLFAAGVLLGLKSLLPHIGTDTIDLLAGSLALASQVNITSFVQLMEYREV